MSCAPESRAGWEGRRNAAMTAGGWEVWGSAAGPPPPEGAGAVPVLGMAACGMVRANFRGGMGRKPWDQALRALAAAGSVVRSRSRPAHILSPAARRERGEGRG